MFCADFAQHTVFRSTFLLSIFRLVPGFSDPLYWCQKIVRVSDTLTLCHDSDAMKTENLRTLFFLFIFFIPTNHRTNTCSTYQLLLRKLFLLGLSRSFSTQLAAQRQVSEDYGAASTQAQVFPLSNRIPRAHRQSLAQNPPDHPLHPGGYPHLTLSIENGIVQRVRYPYDWAGGGNPTTYIPVVMTVFTKLSLGHIFTYYYTQHSDASNNSLLSGKLSAKKKKNNSSCRYKHQERTNNGEMREI